MSIERFKNESWFGVLAQALGVDRDELQALLKQYRDRNGGETKVSNTQLFNWSISGPGAYMKSAKAVFLHDFLGQMEVTDRIVDQDAANDLALFFTHRAAARTRKDKTPASHEEAAEANSFDALFGYFLGRAPGRSRTPPGRDGFYLVLRRKFHGSSVYQELMYIGENAGAPSYMITYSGRVLIGRVLFDGRHKAYCFFGAPYEFGRGYSIRMQTIHFAEMPHGRPGSGMVARITSNKGTSTASRTVYWHLDENNSKTSHGLQTILQSMKQNPSVSLKDNQRSEIGRFITEYHEDHPIYKRLAAHLPEPDKLPDQGALTDTWEGGRNDPALEGLLQHLYEHGEPEGVS